MATATLNKFTVPLTALGTEQETQGLLMPKLKYRFRVTFTNFGVSTTTSELTKQVNDVSRPNVNFNPFVIDVYNSKINLVGKPTWEPITVNLRDDSGGNVSKLVGEQIQKQFDFAEQASASTGIDYKFTMKIEMLDGGNGKITNNTLETWELYGAFVSQVNYGEMNYGTNEAVMIQLTVTYDNAIQTPAGTGVGTLLSRTLISQAGVGATTG